MKLLPTLWEYIRNLLAFLGVMAEYCPDVLHFPKPWKIQRMLRGPKRELFLGRVQDCIELRFGLWMVNGSISYKKEERPESPVGKITVSLLIFVVLVARLVVSSDSNE